MAHPARPLRIAIVSPDSGLLHELSWLLTAVGYLVVTSKDLGENAAWRQFCQADFLVFDGRSISNPTQATLAHRSDNPLHRIFLYDPTVPIDLTAWFAAGANDALRVPVSRGELLSRIRAGARTLEFENRMRCQSSRSRLPGMYSKRGLLHKLNRFITEGKSIALGHTLLTIAVDFFAGFCREEGESAARGLLKALTTSIHESAGDSAIAAYNGDGTFHILLPDRDVPAAHIVAEHITQKFRTLQDNRESDARLSVTTAIVPWQAGTSAEQLLKQGQETLAVAQQSGSDCAVEQNKFAHELTNWQNEVSTGNPFASLIAQDIMEPFPALVEHDLPSRALLVALRRSGTPVWPFVDHDGRLVGVASPESATDASVDSESSCGGFPALAKGDTIAHNAAFSEIYEAFSTQGCQAIVVVAGNRPVGYLTRSGFFSLIQPIDSATYSSDNPALDDSRSLVVGSLVNESELTSDFDQSHFRLPLREPLDRKARSAMR